MSLAGRKSNCSVGVPVDFYWWNCNDPDPVAHIEENVSALWEAIRAPGRRLWNPYNTATVKGEFRQRLKRAAAGNLRPIDEVKPMDPAADSSLFEIRWNTINTVERVDGAPARFATARARLIHAEPLEPGVLCAVGLHAHEKVVFDNDPKATRDAQDREVEFARAREAQCALAGWPVVR